MLKYMKGGNKKMPDKSEEVLVAFEGTVRGKKAKINVFKRMLKSLVKGHKGTVDINN